MFNIKRALIAAAAITAVSAIFISACGGSETPAPSTPSQAQTQEPSGTVNNDDQEIIEETPYTSKTGEAMVKVTVRFNGNDYDFRRTEDGVWSDSSVELLRHLVLYSNGYWVPIQGIERTHNYEDADCTYSLFAGEGHCIFTTAFGYEDDVYLLDTDKADQCKVVFQFEDRFSFNANFWVITGEMAPSNGPDEEYIVKRHEELGTSPTRDELHAFGQDGLPCAATP